MTTKSQKGIAPIILILIIAGILVVGGGIFVKQKILKPKPPEEIKRILSQPTSTEAITKTKSEESRVNTYYGSYYTGQIVDIAVSRGIYRNKDYGFELRFPESWSKYKFKARIETPFAPNPFNISPTIDILIPIEGKDIDVYGIVIISKEDWSENYCENIEGPCYQGKLLGKSEDYVFEEQNAFLMEDPCLSSSVGEDAVKDEKFCKVYRDMYKDNFGVKSFKIIN